jgi:hypothetical protein
MEPQKFVELEFKSKTSRPGGSNRRAKTFVRQQKMQIMTAQP